MINIIDYAEMNKKMDKIIENQSQIKEAGIPKQETKGLTESMAKPKFDYKATVAKALGDTSMGQFNANTFLSETIPTIDGTAAVPIIWAKDVFRCCPYPASAFLHAPFIKWHDDLKGPGSELRIVVVGKALGGTIACEEPSGTAPVITAASITLSDYQCSVYICRDDLEDMVEDTVTEINNSLISCLDTWIDNYFIAGLVGLGSTLVKTPGTFLAAYIAEAMGSMRSGTCAPVALIIHPVVEARLMQEDQFVNAATFGDRSVITDGHVINYLGLQIVVVPKGSLVYGTPGTYRSLLLSQYAVHGAVKRDPIIETQYQVHLGKRTVMASTRLGKTAVCNDGIVWIHAYA